MNDNTIEEAAALLKVSPATISGLIKSGELEAYSASLSPTSRKPRLRIPSAAIDRFIESRRVPSRKFT